MEFKNSLTFLFVMLLGFLVSSQACDFIVGGKDGWVLKPSESYSQWAQRNKFQINDTLVFKYTKGEDYVLAVHKEDYDTCNTTNPVTKLDDGDSKYNFGTSGPFYFISGNQTSCQNGQKLLVVVLSPRTKSPPSPTGPTPQSSPPTPSGGAAPGLSGGGGSGGSTPGGALINNQGHLLLAFCHGLNSRNILVEMCNVALWILFALCIPEYIV